MPGHFGTAQGAATTVVCEADSSPGSPVYRTTLPPLYVWITFHVTVVGRLRHPRTEVEALEELRLQASARGDAGDPVARILELGTRMSNVTVVPAVASAGPTTTWAMAGGVRASARAGTRIGRGLRISTVSHLTGSEGKYQARGSTYAATTA